EELVVVLADALGKVRRQRHLRVHDQLDAVARRGLEERQHALDDRLARRAVLIGPHLSGADLEPPGHRDPPVDSGYPGVILPERGWPRRAAGNDSGWTGPSGAYPLCVDFFSNRPAVAGHFGKLRSRQPSGPPSATKCLTRRSVALRLAGWQLPACARRGWLCVCCSPSRFSDFFREDE